MNKECWRRGAHLHGAGLGSEAAEDHVSEAAVHAVAHDFREESTGRSDERADDGQHGLIKNETCMKERKKQ